ncbi:SlyX family protein [Psychrobacter frigidicola]|uniref:SlyX family protein n=1 Tax=Psychrobacter frigidicola TaxID=45611 RepID=A0A5C7A4T6_9GAMM|nr:SlyX family protein [Psychrobacter frigidicola]TXD97594.1 SlyX family protein [Psychrobacter frigidicola]
MERTQNINKSQQKSLSVPTELQEQMIELQMNIAHLELTVERLNDVVTQQDKHIRNLQRQLQLVYKQVESQSADDGIAPFDVIADRPPHY